MTEAPRKVAIVHDFFCNIGGSDVVASLLHGLFPQAPVYTLLVYDRNRGHPLLRGMDLRTSFIQRLPLAGRAHQPYLPLFPLAIEQFDLSAYDLVLSSSHSCAKGVLTRPETLHICYCHTPMRYAWDLYYDYVHTELRQGLFRPLAALVMAYVRLWDAAAAGRVDYYVANSAYVASRIRKHYRREAEVIYPPVDTDYFVPGEERGDFFLVVSRLTRYKRVDLAVEAFNRLGLPLKVIGEGPELPRLRRLAGPNVEFLGYRARDEVRRHMAACRAFVFPGLEDFGIAPVEAQAAGRPVIAYGAGGVLETVEDGVTGVLFAAQTVDALAAAVERSLGLTFETEACRRSALRFDRSVFLERVSRFVDEKWRAWGAGCPHQTKPRRAIANKGGAA